jgi:hypothetical protein
MTIKNFETQFDTHYDTKFNPEDLELVSDTSMELGTMTLEDTDLNYIGTNSIGLFAGTSSIITNGQNLTFSTSNISQGFQLDSNQGITINNLELEKVLNQILERLSILVPDPKLLEKYQSLQAAYEHYKTLEALCVSSEDSNDPKS